MSKEEAFTTLKRLHEMLDDDSTPTDIKIQAISRIRHLGIVIASIEAKRVIIEEEEAS